MSAIEYVHCGDYLIPLITLNEPPPEMVEPLGRYAQELAALTAERYALCEEYYKLKDDVKSVEYLRRGAENIMNNETPEQTRTRTQDISL